MCVCVCVRACVRRPDVCTCVYGCALLIIICLTGPYNKYMYLGRIWFGCFKVSRHVAFVRLFKRLVNNGRQNTIQPAVKGTGVVFKVVIWTGS